MVDSYIRKKVNNNYNKKVKDNYIFGLVFGFSITIIFIYRFLNRRLGVLSIIDTIFVLYGIFCILIATINPNFKVLTNIRKLNVKIFNFIGSLILKLILFIIYFILVVPVGLYMKNKEKTKAIKTTFVEYKNSYNINHSKYKFLKIFKLFSSEYFYIIPLVIILLIISILVFLITTSSFTPFIYSLF